jgi:hypothetical protein
MLLPKSRFHLRLAGCLAGALLLLKDAVAQTGNDVTSRTNLTAGLHLGLLPGEFVGREQVIRARLRSGSDHEFIFVVPDDLRAEALPGGGVVMVSRDLRYSVAIRLVQPSPAGSELRAALLNWIATQYGQTNTLEEFMASVAQREGIGFQFRHELRQVGARRMSFIWVPFKAGVMEFVFNADERCPSACRAAFDVVLLTFRSNESGKLEIIKRSDKT